MSTCLNLPSLSCSLSSEDIPHTLTLALLQVTLTSYRTPVLISAPPQPPSSFFSLSLSPSNKGDMSVAQRLFLSLSFHSFSALSLLHLSIKPTKGGRCSVRKAFRFLSRSSSVAAPFLSAHIFPLCVFYSLSSSSVSIPFSHPICAFPLSTQ